VEALFVARIAGRGVEELRTHELGEKRGVERGRPLTVRRRVLAVEGVVTLQRRADALDVRDSLEVPRVLDASLDPRRDKADGGAEPARGEREVGESGLRARRSMQHGGSV
jgi:hypothetical protein